MELLESSYILYKIAQSASEEEVYYLLFEGNMHLLNTNFVGVVCMLS